jgi:hypothetical protein
MNKSILLLTATLSLTGCFNFNSDNESNVELVSEGRVRGPVQINRYTALYQVKDQNFDCNIAVNSFRDTQGAGIDCKVTDQGRFSGVRDEIITINGYTDLHIVNVDARPSFIVTNSEWNTNSPAISTP